MTTFLPARAAAAFAQRAPVRKWCGVKRLGVLLVLFTCVPAWCAKKITVAQLEDLLRSAQQDKKSDAEIATALEQIELSEELTRSVMNGLGKLLPGPLATEQIYVLEARSADRMPPPADLPSTPAPDAETQKAILDKAAVYVTKEYSQLPALAALKTTLRFQDNVEAVTASSGLQNGASEVDTSAGFSNPATFVHYIHSSQAQVVSEHGAEKPPAEKDKTPWGANGMTALEQPDPSLAVVFREAQAAGSIHWLRWEIVNGQERAVYAFAVPRKKSRLELDVCCFPKVNQAGIATFYTAATAATLGDGAGPGGGVRGNFQTITEWQEYRSTVAYHGEFFIDAATGVVVRMITEAELKPAEVVHRVDTRIDYGPETIGDRTLMVPAKTIVNAEVVPKGESGAGGYTTRCTLFTSEFKDYQPAGSAQ